MTLIPKKLGLFLLLILCCFFSHQSYGEGRGRTLHRTVEVFNFHLSGVYFEGNLDYQKQYGGKISWVPLFEILPDWNLRFELGVAGLPRTNKQGLFFRPNYEAFFQFELVDGLGLEVGGGFQNWLETSIGDVLVGSGNLFYAWSETFLGIDRFFVGYSYLKHNGLELHEVRAGLGFQIY